MEMTKKEESKKRTNYDDIRNFSVNKMARFLANLLPIPGPKEAKVKAMKVWLMEEAEE